MKDGQFFMSAHEISIICMHVKYDFSRAFELFDFCDFLHLIWKKIVQYVNDGLTAYEPYFLQDFYVTQILGKIFINFEDRDLAVTKIAKVLAFSYSGGRKALLRKCCSQFATT